MKLSFSPFFKRMSLDQQLEFTKNVVKNLETNPKYLLLSSNVAELDLKLQEWETACKEAQFGGKMRAIKKIEKGLTVFNQLSVISQKIDTINYGRKGIVETAGYNACREVVLSPISNTGVLSEMVLEPM